MTRFSHFQNIVAGVAIAMVGLSVCVISFVQEPAEAYLFPRLISVVFAALSVWTAAKAFSGHSNSSNGLSEKELANIAPGLVAALIYIFLAAETLGFYTASTIAFFAVYSIYDTASHRELRSWGKRIVLTALFIAVMYGLFAKVLTVFTPREFFQ
ncbi:MAG: tripartite tricarboxylate transporter TctB family protein [Roseovarius sp.]|nr:tripartite tricarboxylate transporter TctB family protein [Roseovarius sp.]MCY4208116.1 tripartite tricarboxylate transporter TctB family protein [Roseovarius sp.]MCY4290379.1 tripartite tricarboxylate transporter TctB family protein [Roseovarius sp.]MCY4317127.1 tripartite tricarboxylate transporter TctB family protein [Roseovarius sp.]